MSKKYIHDWFDCNIPMFDRFLNVYKNKNTINFLEIGSFEGRSTCWLLDNILTSSSSTITCIDSWKGGWEHQILAMSEVESNFINNTKEYANKVIPIKSTSYNALLSIQNNIEYYDFVYIDGGHTMKDVLQDAILSFPLIKKGGIIAFDDYQWELQQPVHLRPEQGINAFVAAYSTELSTLYVGSQVWLKKN